MDKKTKNIFIIVYALVSVFTLAVTLKPLLSLKFLATYGIILLFILGIVYFVLNIKAKQKHEEIVLKSPKENVREVKFLKPMELVKGEEKEISETYPLIHVDNADDKEMVIRVFKTKASIPDSSAEINK